MLKQLPSRSHKVKGFKVKHAVKICLLLVICIWLVYKLNHSHGEDALDVGSAERVSGVTQNEHGLLVLGRRGLLPRVEETPMDVQIHRETEEEPEDYVDETKAEEGEGGGKGGSDEVDEHDQDKSDEDSEGVEDVIDVDDTEREEEEDEEIDEENGEQESEEKENDSDDQVPIRDESYSLEAKEEQYKGHDASSAMKRKIRSITNKIKVGSLRKLKEDSTEFLDSQEGNKATGERGNSRFDSLKIVDQAYAGSSTNRSEKPKMNHWLSLWNRYANQVLL